MKKGDFAIIILVIVLFISWSLPVHKGSEAAIYVSGELYRRLPLDKNTTVVVKSRWGTNTVVIKDKKVRITNSDCPGKDCEQDSISPMSHSLICLPNRLAVIIENTKTKNETDVII